MATGASFYLLPKTTHNLGVQLEKLERQYPELGKAHASVNEAVADVRKEVDATLSSLRGQFDQGKEKIKDQVEGSDAFAETKKKVESMYSTRSSAQEWSYFSHRESIGKALSSPGIRANKKTRINCGSSARMAGNVCANVDQIRRQGRLNNTTINGAYLTNLPRELVRSTAGFPTYDRFFYIACAALNPPSSLCKKLFPAIGK
ncbi:hypothetical protein [Absidia glauca]|uniref:Ndc10 domain-containing protein n=1 Tax=Absidia glauca TaxID=4829 RepID=A0A163J511_ABSGL|nr:hypothetical protein [Absidia glauca]